MEYKIINGGLYREDAENLTRKRVCEGSNFHECENYFLSQQRDHSILVLKSNDPDLLIRTIDFIDYSGKFGLIYKCGDNYYLWQYNEKVEKNLGSWKEGSFYLRKVASGKYRAYEYSQYATYVHGNDVQEFPFLSLNIDEYGNMFFAQGINQYRIFDICGHEARTEYFLFRTNDPKKPIFYRKEAYGMYHKLQEVKCLSIVARNAFFAARENNQALMAFDKDVLKELFCAPADDWSLVTDPGIDGDEQNFIACGRQIWTIGSNGILSCEPLEIPDSFYHTEKQVSKPLPWYKRIFRKH